MVVYPGPNDLSAVFFRPGRVARPRPTDNLAFVRLLTRLRQPMVARRAVLPPRTLAPYELDRLRASIVDIVKAARDLGARPVLVTHALRVAQGTTGATAHESFAEACLLLGVDCPSTLAAYDAVERLTREIGAAQNVPVVDLRGAIPADDLYWGDATHFAAPGSERAGQVVGEALAAMVP